MKLNTFIPHLIALAIFLLTVVVMFLPQFQGKALTQGDLVQYRGASKEYNEYYKSEGERPNWTGSMFGGMPTYQISAVTEGNLLKYARRAFFGFMGGPAGYAFCGMLCFYLFMILLGVNPWLSIAGAMGAAIATNNLVLFEAGHVSKLNVIVLLPLIAGGILLAFRRRYLIGGALFALGMGLGIMANHPQMLYYFAMTLIFLGGAQFVVNLRRGELPHFAKAMGVLIVGLVLAVGAGASNLLTTTEYLPQSTRGGQVLQNNAPATGETSAGADGGLDWDYAMAWSNGFKDMLATFSPLAAGGGSGQEVTNQSEFGRAMRRAGFNVPATFPAPLYHGSLPFTEGPIYLGAVIWALFVFGLFTASVPLRIWLGGGTLLIFIISMGDEHFSGFNRFLFDTLPLLNKFRTPNSALSVCNFLMITLGIFGIQGWLKTRDGDQNLAGKQLRNAGLVSAALGIAVVLLGFTLDYTAPNDAATIARFTGGNGDVNVLISALEVTRAEVYWEDATRSLLFVGLTFAALFMVWRGTLSVAIGSGLLAALVLADFVGVNNRYLTHEDFEPRRVVQNPIQATPADEQILQDPDPHYRVLNLSRDLDKDAFTSYFHKSLGGYSAAKLRRYDDLLGGYLRTRDEDVINMLNTKYILVPGENGQLQAQRNSNAYGNAWLVNDIEQVASPDAAYRALGTVNDLNNTAIIEPEYADAIAGLNPNGQGQVTLTGYKPSELTYSFSSPSEQLVVFSEIWYGPDLGWEATINGQPAELIRANYALRALRVPAGEHTIVMSFTPSSYSTGYIISLICSLLIIVGVLGLITYSFLQRKRVKNTATPTTVMTDQGGAAGKQPARSKRPAKKKKASAKKRK